VHDGHFSALASRLPPCDDIVVAESLARVADPRALDDAAGGRARLAIVVPASWLDDGAELELTLPARLACARCDGGGCDGCARSGALRTPEGEVDRTLRTNVPPGSARGVALRIPHPFGPDHEVAQLLVEVRAGESASACVARVEVPVVVAPAAPRLAAPIPWALVAAIATLGAILAAIFGR
jgi:hypothetical protein